MTFGWVELCATEEPENALSPVPQVNQKMYYNSYVYVPERTYQHPQFLDRFLPSGDGEWIDTFKVEQMKQQILNIEAQGEEERLQAQREREITSGLGVELTPYTDSITGEPLYMYNGELLTMKLLYDKYNIHPSRLQRLKTFARQPCQSCCGFEFDSLRPPLRFHMPERNNKRIAQHAYDWFDRTNPRIPTDDSYKFIELPSIISDADMYGRWRENDHYALTATHDRCS